MGWGVVMCGGPHVLLDSLSSEGRGERIEVGLFLKGNFLMEQREAFSVSCLSQVLWKLRVSFPRAEV